MNTSIVFVVLLSWNGDNTGSLADLSKLTPQDDKVDRFLLELLVALVLRSEGRSAIRAIFPVLIGTAEKSGFGTFPFHNLRRLSERPSEKTNAVASMILNKLGVSQQKIEDMKGWSVKRTVELILRNQGMQASEVNAGSAPFGSGPGAAFIQLCAIKVLRTVQQELRMMRTDPEQFRNTRPMADEVLEFLSRNCLSSYAVVLANHDVDTLAMLAALRPKQVALLNEEHEQVYPLRGKQGSVGGQMNLQMAVDALKNDEMTLPLKVRLDQYKDAHSSAMAALMAGNAVEMVFSKSSLRCFMLMYGLNWLGLTAASFSIEIVEFLNFECVSSGCKSPILWFSMQMMGSLGNLAVTLALLLPLLRPTPLKSYRTFAWFMAAFVLLQLGKFAAGFGEHQGFWAEMFLWLLVVIGLVLIIYRQQWFFVYISVTMPAYIAGTTSLQCQREQELSGTLFADCWYGILIYILMLVVPFVYSFLFLSINFLANRQRAWASTRTERRMHEGAWQAELTKARSGNTIGMLCACADTITQELKRQRDKTLLSLTVTDRVMAWLIQHADRLSLQSSDPKVRQAHDNIDLLFREAAAVRALQLAPLNSTVFPPCRILCVC